jgi:hypothetical protein
MTKLFIVEDRSFVILTSDFGRFAAGHKLVEERSMLLKEPQATVPKKGLLHVSCRGYSELLFPTIAGLHTKLLVLIFYAALSYHR